MRKSCWCIILFIGWFWLFITVAAHSQTIHPQVTRLNQALEHYRQVANENTWASLPNNICLRPNDSSEYIINLRNNLFLTRDLPKPDTSTIPVYDKALIAAVSRFQERHGLKADGIVGQLTLQALNVSPSQRMRQMELNLLRWQADTAALATPRVLVNIPDFTLQILDANYKTIWQTRVIVGQKDKGLHTAVLASKISYLVLNPTWNIPNSIVRKEIIPILRKDRGYLARNHMILYRLQGARKHPVSVNSINWHTVDPERDGLMIIQSPGKDNALGLIKFIFDNPYHIYLHDTPVKSLFVHDSRAYSHGCVRVQNPEILGAYLLNQNWGKTAPKPLPLKVSGIEKIVYLPRPVPIKIGYYTSWVTDQGLVQFRDDIYKLDHFTSDFKIPGL